MRYKSLSPTQAELLFVIWKLQASTPDQMITTTEISKKLNTSEGHIRKIIMDISRLQENLILRRQCFDKKRRMGRPRTSYFLNFDSIATLPETALILLELTRFPTEKAFRIRRNDFERYVKTIYGLSADYIQGIINKAINHKYIEETGYDYIYPGSRIFCEEGYLSLIASEIDSQGIKTKSVSLKKSKPRKK